MLVNGLLASQSDLKWPWPTCVTQWWGLAQVCDLHDVAAYFDMHPEYSIKSESRLRQRLQHITFPEHREQGKKKAKKRLH